MNSLVFKTFPIGCIGLLKVTLPVDIHSVQQPTGILHFSFTLTEIRVYDTVLLCFMSELDRQWAVLFAFHAPPVAHTAHHVHTGDGDFKLNPNVGKSIKM